MSWVAKVGNARTSPLRLVFWGLAAALLVTSSCLPQAPLVLVVLDSSVRHQTIDGIGGAASQPEHLRALPEPTRTQVMDLVFGELDPSMVRLRIPHTIEPVNDNGDPATTDSSQLVAPSDLLWQQAELFARANPYTVAAPWSPPAWMKDTGKTCCSGSLIGGMEPELAEWLSAAVGFLGGSGHPLDALSIQNEPEVIAPWDVCTYSLAGLAAATEAVAQRLESDGRTTRLVTADTGAAFMTQAYTPEVMAQPTAAARMRAIAFHLYQVVPYFEPWKAPTWLFGPLWMSDTYGLPIWMTEYSNVDGNFGSYEEALALAQHLHYALGNGVSAYLIWNLYYPWSVGEALVHISQSGGSGYTVTPKYYTAKQYMRYVRPGAVRIDATSDDEDLLVTGYEHGVDRTLVVVAINRAESRRTLAIDTGHGPLDLVAVIRTSPGENAVPVLVVPPEMFGPQILTMPARSVATLVWSLP